MSLLFLVWAIAFFFLPEFRQGIGLSLVARDWQWLIRAGALSPQKLEKYARLGEQQRDARTLAFVALHSRNKDERVRWAGQAVALDPQFTWIDHTLIVQSPNDPQVDQWIARLKTWDPDNALPYRLEAQRAIDRTRKWVQPSNLDELTKETDWRQAMAKAFAAPRYDSYARRRFELERACLHENRLDHPATVLVSVMSYPVPRWLNIHMYGEPLLTKLGPDAERSNHVPEAIRYYSTAAHFGERMQLEELVLLERITGAALQFGRLDLPNGRDPLATGLR